MKRKTIILTALFCAVICLLSACTDPISWIETDNETTKTAVKYDEYENVDVFAEAERYGYTVTECSFSDRYYAVFSLNGTSILISGQQSNAGSIALYDCIMTKTELGSGRFAYYATSYSDGKTDQRNEYGHWVFTNEHKYELVSLLRDYSQRGVIAFANFYSDACSFMDADYSNLISNYNLLVRYQKVDSRYYRFLFFDTTGKSAWFVAEYSEADIKSEAFAYGLNTWEKYSGNIAGLRGDRFSRDYVKKDGLLHSSSERIEQLKIFFDN